jgi:ABC-2 type transport system ATP-binding protein
LIGINHLSFAYPHRPNKTLDDINLVIEKGSSFGLLGPNGAGKTTLISILSGLLPYSTGSITINGKELAELHRDKQPVCALVPQSLAFYPQLTGKENLEFFAAMLGIPKNRIKTEIERCLTLTQLTSYADMRSATYSGGVKRRLNIAIGLLNSPGILFLDEPTVGIDAQSRNFILESIKSINQAGTTIIYTSHYMEEVENLCEKIAIIDHGKILLHGKLQDILSKKQTLSIYTKTPVNEEQLQELRQHNLIVSQHLHTLDFAIDNDQQRISQTVAALTGMKIDIDKLAYGTQNLEQLFLDKTDRQLRD